MRRKLGRSYKKALVWALMDANYKGNAKSSTYVLHADLVDVDVDKHYFAKGSTVNMKVEYTLSEKISGKEIFKKTIKTTHDASSSDSVDGITPLMIAIKMSIEKIYINSY